MANYEMRSNRPEDTYWIAEKLGKLLAPNDVILLEGDLGAGKTTFTKGLAAGLDIQRTVNSPTFTIIKEYQGRLPLYHMDVYRVKDSLEDLGLEEYFYNHGVSVVEWAHLIEGQLPSENLTVYLYYDGDTSRKLVLQPKGKRYEVLCEELWNENFSH
ncbi:tRNA (adenosine(37)-N6)-threonylcarbamoyltransferase complex ATPase subunit type 1 TsaE [Lederbergia sp. NSJ-179]|uniref:tRNA (adenosine(37)-N6)-threonylcarbamoyltransferase complex ATPase subunit type 1 TsaE n=1 Tax=Lederbergia sp. NSJ-179 TaxID=2931402 RepID=UPI001FD012BB|nr:tRNA (adenosine(37)-N6)-threonylcarbamoyltransferase complex ATPase subunit type 1 TsaE [Lederbergia sp. NSJ-179]MCJ7841385.1 tRNA (adenosine(37)-N6)-threonylcarbamoyltransferase complex ATPase subunit type 1 TsaE [Lederbergia sp. NSJ-179]